MNRRVAVTIIFAGASIAMGSGTSGAEDVKLAKATLAGGCFWCTEAVYAELKGVKAVTSGYIGGAVPNPTYKDVWEVIAKLDEAKVFPRKIVTEVTKATTFYPAEDYHQDYFANNPFQPYCQAVAAPKVDKVRKVFKDLLK